MKRFKYSKLMAVMLIFTFMLQLFPSVSFAVGRDAYPQFDAEEIISQISAAESPADKEIVAEDTGKRSANEKHFKLEDGSYVIAQYVDAVHYEDENGEWVDIDNTLISEKAKNADDFDGYTNKNNSFDVKLAENGKDQLLRIDEDDYSVSMKLSEEDAANSVIAIENSENDISAAEDMSAAEKNEQAMQLNKLESKAEFSNILPGIDIEYAIQSQGVKEYIIVNERRNGYEFSFELALENLIPRENENGSISLMANDGEEKYIIPAPYMFDANEQYSSDVVYSITNMGGGKYILTVSADEEWINDATLPVKIDPSIISVDSGAEIQDVFVSEATGSSSINLNSVNTNFIGNHSTYGNTKTYINWSGIIKEEISSYVITSAKLNYYQTEIDRSATPSIVAYQVTGEWAVDTICGDNQPSHSSEILDYVDSESITANSRIELDITYAILDYFNGTNQNGIVLTANSTATGTTNIQLVSSGNSDDVSKMPTIEIYYRNQKGIDEDYTYLPIECGNAGTAYINTYNGDVAFVHETLEVGPIKINQVYNTYMTYINEIDRNLDELSASYLFFKPGTGWKLSLQDIIVPISETEYEEGRISLSYSANAANDLYVYNNEYGTNVYLFKTENGNYEDREGLGYELTVSENEYVLTKTDAESMSGWTKTFKIVEEKFYTKPRNVGYITSYADIIIDDTGEITVNDDSYLEIEYASAAYTTTSSGATKGYPSRLRSITGDYGGIAVNFTVLSTNSYLQTITSDERTISLTYGTTDSSGDNLMRIDDSEVGRTTFTYDGDTLTSVTAPDGNEISMCYDDNGCLDYVEWKSSATATPIRIDFTFDRGVTTVHYYGNDALDSTADNNSTDDLFIKYLFDTNGNSTAVYTLNYKMEANEAVAYTGHTGIDHVAINDPNMNYTCYAGETLTTGSSYYDPSSDPSPIEISSDAHTGEFSYKLSSTSSMGDSMSKTMSLTAGTHTISAYIKCTDGIADGKIYLNAYNLNDETWQSSEGITQTDGWEKVDFTFTISQAGLYELAVFVSGAGVVMVDDVTIDGRGVTWSINDNAYISTGFEGDSIYWETSSYTKQYASKYYEYYLEDATVPSTIELNSENVLFGDYSLKINDSIGAERSIYHTYYLNYNDLESNLVLSGWGKADSVPTTDPSSRGFELFAYYIYRVKLSDGTYETRTVSTAVPFNWQNDEWQFVSQELNMPELAEGEEFAGYYSVTFGALYKGNTGNAYFDNIQLIPAEN